MNRNIKSNKHGRFSITIAGTIGIAAFAFFAAEHRAQAHSMA